MAVLAVTLLVLAVVVTVHDARSEARDQRDQSLLRTANRRAAALSDYFERARTTILLIAQNPVFEELAPDAPPRPDRTRAASLRQAARAMRYLETLYPGQISEACLIAADGTELARVVDRSVARDDDLSADETGAPFFTPTLRLRPGQVHQSRPYVSEDTATWVVANAVPLATGTERPWAIVHFEVRLDSLLGRGATDSAAAQDWSVLDRRSGERIPDGRRAAALPADLLVSARGHAAPVATSWSRRRTALVRVPVGADNQNAWTVVVTEPAGARVGWWDRVGPAPAMMALAALLLLLYAATSLRAAHRTLHRASHTDELTGLPNRRLVTLRLTEALAGRRRRDGPSALLMIDLDRFKEVNDTLGHQHGDALLQAVAGRLAGSLRHGDTVARLGGDEFAVLLPDVVDVEAATHLAGVCLDALHQPFAVHGVLLNVEASIGLALAPEHGHDATALMRAADVAMYEAKARHGGVVVYEPGTDIHTPTRLAMLGDLRRAIQGDELFLDYQPKVSLVTGTATSVEALVRWRHPSRGLVAPTEFIPVAEGTGLMMPLTLLTIDLAVAQAARWQGQDRPVQVAVNLSPRCLLEGDLLGAVRTVLDRHGLPPRLLRLEVTESTFMTDPARAHAVLTGLRGLGISLSIDDFGTGYSSMSHLKQLPVDELKIDRAFVTHMLQVDSDDVLVRSSIDLAHNLGLSVVAEGVEDQETVDALLALGCDVVQGFHLGTPMSPAMLEQWWGGGTDASGHPSPGGRVVADAAT